MISVALYFDVVVVDEGEVSLSGVLGAIIGVTVVVVPGVSPDSCSSCLDSSLLQLQTLITREWYRILIFI